MDAQHTTTGPTPPPLRSALKSDNDNDKTPPASASLKAVQIAEPEPEPTDEPHHIRQFTAGIGRRLSGRPYLPHNSSRTSLASATSQISLESLVSTAQPSPLVGEDTASPHRHHHRIERASERLLGQLAEWLHHEKTKKESRKTRKVPGRKKLPPAEGSAEGSAGDARLAPRNRANSFDSLDSDVSLDRLQRIIDDSMAALGLNHIPHHVPRPAGRRLKSARNLLHARTASSDTDYVEGDAIVPSCDSYLDNSKTMSYGGGECTNDEAAITPGRRDKDKKAWITFKNEIIRLSHTLRLKGWRRVPLDAGETIGVERLSGALTNAVYVVTPPRDLGVSSEGKKPPKKVLLRVYGPQVEHLIDRENELDMLRRLARKRIGPRLLGTFNNGRFEEFFNATTLTPKDLRDPDTSKLIAKRMRELHDGIELLGQEKLDGPGVWGNWDRWLDQVEKTITFCDKAIAAGSSDSARGPLDAWKARGYVLGVEWPRFKAMIEKYRKFLDDYYGGSKQIRNKLVFAHNDTQYGNILRIHPEDDKSPLLQPANIHKQLVVIDFEYAAPNVRGYEFANHFVEWMYNYLDSPTPHACNPSRYPTQEEQYRFIKAYVDHRPQLPNSPSTPNLTPLATPSEPPPLLSTSSSTSIVDFMLDAREPRGGWSAEDARHDEAVDERVKELMDETRLWRIANSAMWTTWGLVQAKVPGLKLMSDPEDGPAEDGVPEEEEVEEAEFDYLGYAQERAMLFWGDCVQMGFVRREELPKEMVAKLKFVN